MVEDTSPAENFEPIVDDFDADEGFEPSVGDDDPPSTENTPASEAATGKESGKERTVPYQALKEERLKRQEIARQLQEAQLRAQIASEQTRQTPKAEPEPEWTDDEIYADVPKAVKGVKQQLTKQMQQELRALKYGQSEVHAKATYKDYDEVMGHYQRLASSHPHIAKMVDDHVSPAFMAYEIAKRDLKMSKAVSPEEFEAKINEQVAKRVSEELKRVKRELAGEVPPSMDSGRDAAQKRPQNARDTFAQTWKR